MGLYLRGLPACEAIKGGNERQHELFLHRFSFLARTHGRPDARNEPQKNKRSHSIRRRCVGPVVDGEDHDEEDGGRVDFVVTSGAKREGVE